MAEIISYEERYKNQVISLILHIQNEENDLKLSIDEQPELKDIGKAFLFNGGGFWLAVENNEVIGTIALMKATGNGGILKKFFVDEKHRGKKTGLQLYETLMTFCRNNRIQQIVLDTPSVAIQSHAFYRKAGFVEIEKEQLPFPYRYPDRSSLLFLKEI